MATKEEIKQYLVSLLGGNERNMEFEKENFIYFSNTSKDFYHFEIGCRFCTYFCSMYRPIFNEKDIDKLLNSGWNLYSKLCDVVDNSRYFRNRWVINHKICRVDWKYKKCEDIYKQAKGYMVDTVEVGKVVRYIEAIDEDVWKISKALINRFGNYIKSPVSHIEKVGDEIILYKKGKKKKKGGSIGAMLFSEDDIFKIKADECEDFIVALDLLEI